MPGALLAQRTTPWELDASDKLVSLPNGTCYVFLPDSPARANLTDFSLTRMPAAHYHDRTGGGHVVCGVGEAHIAMMKHDPHNSLGVVRVYATETMALVHTVENVRMSAPGRKTTYAGYAGQLAREDGSVDLLYHAIQTDGTQWWNGVLYFDAIPLPRGFDTPLRKGEAPRESTARARRVVAFPHGSGLTAPVQCGADSTLFAFKGPRTSPGSKEVFQSLVVYDIAPAGHGREEPPVLVASWSSQTAAASLPMTITRAEITCMCWAATPGVLQVVVNCAKSDTYCRSDEYFARRDAASAGAATASPKAPAPASAAAGLIVGAASGAVAEPLVMNVPVQRPGKAAPQVGAGRAPAIAAPTRPAQLQAGYGDYQDTQEQQVQVQVAVQRRRDVHQQAVAILDVSEKVHVVVALLVRHVPLRTAVTHRLVPRDLRAAMRAVAWLRWRVTAVEAAAAGADAGPLQQDQPAQGGAGRAGIELWASLPFEVFEFVMEAAWRQA